MAAQWPEDSASSNGQGINSAATGEDDTIILSDTPIDFDYFDKPTQPVGEAVDAEIVDDSGPRMVGSRLGARGRSKLKSVTPEMTDREAKAGIPSLDEWLHFFGDIVIRLGTDYYIERAFQGVDEDLLSDRELDKILLTEKERGRIARPFAEYANKLKFTRKHGRMIIASADSVDALLQLGLWFSRVNRIAAKYRPMRGVKAQRNNMRASPVFIPAERMPTYQPPEEPTNVGFGQSETAQQNGNGDHWRPDIGGTVFNTNLG